MANWLLTTSTAEKTEKEKASKPANKKRKTKAAGVFLNPWSNPAKMMRVSENNDAPESAKKAGSNQVGVLGCDGEKRLLQATEQHQQQTGSTSHLSNSGVSDTTGVVQGEKLTRSDMPMLRICGRKQSRYKGSKDDSVVGDAAAEEQKRNGKMSFVWSQIYSDHVDERMMEMGVGREQ
eukprot:760906-Hanusia_phi.AAC.2